LQPVGVQFARTAFVFLNLLERYIKHFGQFFLRIAGLLPKFPDTPTDLVAAYNFTHGIFSVGESTGKVALLPPIKLRIILVIYN